MENLYHYCSSSTFASIVSSRTIWLSSLSLSNDTMEGRLVTQTFERMLAQAKVGAEEMDQIREALRYAESLLDGLGFCLSEKPDLLSQWRGYADDGQGLSIGFSKEYLQKLGGTLGGRGFRLFKVQYEPAEHEAALKPTFDEIKKLVESGKLSRPNRKKLPTDVGEVTWKTHMEEMRKHIDSNDAYHEAKRALWVKTAISNVRAWALKNKAFAEEAEWRLLSWLGKGMEDQASFRASGNRLVPYREFKLEPLEVKAIDKVYIGPRNITPKYVVEKFLAQSGFPDVHVEHSSATYR